MAIKRRNTTEVLQVLAKVAKIVDNGYSLAINKGSQDGVQIGDKFRVYSDEGTLVDPDTGEELGELKVQRGIGRVTQVQEKYSIIGSENYENSSSSSQPYIGQSFSMSKIFGGEPRIRTTFNKADIGDIAERV